MIHCKAGHEPQAMHSKLHHWCNICKAGDRKYFNQPLRARISVITSTPGSTSLLWVPASLFSRVLLSLSLLVLFRWIINQLTLFVDPWPLRLAVIDIDDATSVEHMAAIIMTISSLLWLIWKDADNAHLGSKFFLSSGDLKLIRVGNSKIIFLPSSMIGVRQ